MGNKPYHKESVLRQLYFEEGLTQEEIGQMYGVAQTTIRDWMIKNGIDPQSQYPWRKREWLYNEYTKSDKSIGQIAEEVNTSPATIHDWLKRHDIDINSATLPEKHPLNNKNIVRNLHHDEEYTVKQIAEKYDCSRDAVKKRLEKYGIERKYREDMDTEYDNLFYYTTKDGYERMGTSRPTNVYTSHHQLLMCVNEDPHSVYSNEKHVHHLNKIPWDNRLCNLELKDETEHLRDHAIENGLGGAVR